MTWNFNYRPPLVPAGACVREASDARVVEDLLAVYFPSGFRARLLAYSVRESQNLSRRWPKKTHDPTPVADLLWGQQQRIDTQHDQ